MVNGANPGGIASGIGGSENLRGLRAVSSICVLQADSLRESRFTFGYPAALCFVHGLLCGIIMIPR